MTDDRIVYEWLRDNHTCPRCQGRGHYWSFLNGKMLTCEVCGGSGQDNPSLDMNLAFSECIPRLLPSTHIWFDGQQWHFQERVDESVQRPAPTVSNPDFYEGLILLMKNEGGH